MMNVFFFIILLALIVEYVVEAVAHLLNLKSVRGELPPELEGLYQPEDYRKSQKYLRTNTYLALVSSTFSLVVLLCFWFAGGFNYLDHLVRSWGFVTILSGLLYIGILVMGYSLIMLPFSIYRTFVIEERFGFNRTSPHTFVMDRLKSLGLAALIGGALLSGILALFQYTGSYAWIYGWVASTIFFVIVEYVAPTWIMPLFNKFSPLQPGELREAILDYARSVEFPVRSVFVMDGSRRSTKSNAFFTGFGGNKRIALFDTLIQKHTVPELIAILAHEIGHHKKRHILQGMIINILHAGLLFFLLSIFLDSAGLYEAFYMEQQSIYGGILFFGLLYTPLEMVLSPATHALSRKNEYEADRFAAETIRHPQDLVEALKKLHTSNLSNLTPHPLYVFLNYSHPPLLQRIRAIQQYVA
ncbi:MAG: M48 family metallopeptidase [Dehalococcoidia bacterium]